MTGARGSCPGAEAAHPRPQQEAQQRVVWRQPAPGLAAAAARQDLSRNEWLREFLTALAAGRELPTPPPDAPGPFSLADPARVHSVLTAAGFTDVQLQGLSAPMYFGPDPDDAYRFVRGLTGWMLEGLDTLRSLCRTRLPEAGAWSTLSRTSGGTSAPTREASWRPTRLRCSSVSIRPHSSTCGRVYAGDNGTAATQTV